MHNNLRMQEQVEIEEAMLLIYTVEFCYYSICYYVNFQFVRIAPEDEVTMNDENDEDLFDDEDDEEELDYRTDLNSHMSVNRFPVEEAPVNEVSLQQFLLYQQPPTSQQGTYL